MINEEETFRTYGYRSTGLSYGSHKLVMRICERCGQARWLEFRAVRSFCDPCSTILNNESRAADIPPKNDLVNYYTTCKKSVSKVGDIYGCSNTLILKWLMFYDIPIRTSAEAIVERWSGYKHKTPGKLSYICEHCGKGFECYPSQKHRFCSRGCHHAFFSGKNHPSWEGGKIMIHCKQCKRKYYVYKSRAEKKFCSRKCQGKWKSENMAGASKYCVLWTEKLRESVRDKFNRACFICGKPECENGAKLSVHHTNSGKMCMCDYSCELVPLCRSCHSKTIYNRFDWYSLIMCKLLLESSAQYVGLSVQI